MLNPLGEQKIKSIAKIIGTLCIEAVQKESICTSLDRPTGLDNCTNIYPKQKNMDEL
jgi:hypothetical protein